MGDKLLKDITQPYSRICLAGMLAVSVVLLFFNVTAGVICVVVSAAVFLFNLLYTQKYVEDKLTRHNDEQFRTRADLLEALSNGTPMLLCTIDRNGTVLWNNEKFDRAFPTAESFRAVISKRMAQDFFLNDNHAISLKVGDRSYYINSANIDKGSREKRLLFWTDITARETLKQQFKDGQPCVAFVSVDNYDDLIEATPVEEQSTLAAGIDKAIQGWAMAMDALLCRLKDSKYVMVFEQKHLGGLEEGKFPILNQMHDIESKADFPTSISMGISVGDRNYVELVDAAQEALDLALGRGGDQAVVKRKDGETKYYGGALPTVEKRNKGKSRVMAHMLAQLMENSDNVIIMGHARSDMDSFGAAMGIYALASNLGKDAAIVMNPPDESMELAYNSAKELGAYRFFDHETAMAALSDNSLVVLVDHHRPVISEFPALVTLAKKVVVIDHHRRAGDSVENPVMAHMEVYASSTSELVTELLQYSGDNGEISKFEAETLLAGITVDTKNFTLNTGVRTFEAASWLRRNGADNTNVKNYFRVSLDFYRKKVNLIASAEILENGVAIAYTRSVDPQMQILISQAADELLDMKGVEASVVSGRNADRTLISARSNGKINVQTLMEKLGGGGHQNVAAAQVDVGPEEALAQVVQIMRSEGLL